MPITEKILRMIKIATFAYAGVLIFVIISNLDLFRPNWPFGLFASFSETLILALPIMLIFLLVLWRKAILPVSFLAACAFYPMLLFSQYTDPSEVDCGTSVCLSVVAANLRRDVGALRTLAEIDVVQETDILFILELPHRTGLEDLTLLYPWARNIEIFRESSSGTQLGSPMAVISREKPDAVEYVDTNLTSADFNTRGFITIDYSRPLRSPILIVAVHLLKPDSFRGMAYRQRTIDAMIEHIGNRTDFILVGDFNMTPWEPVFQTLPGKRAGDPRWAPTWNARDPFQRITIDHSLVGSALEVVEADTLSDIGSDHFPIRTLVRMAE